MDYYSILGINKNSSEPEIKKAHRKLILNSHPDKCIFKTENEKINQINKFILINEAFNVLKDPIKKKIYDEKGIEGLNNYRLKEKQQEDIDEARERNKKKKEERQKRQEQKELEKKQKELEEQKQKELEQKQKELEQKEEKRLELERKRKKLIEVEKREKELAEKRLLEIELENNKRIEKEKLEKIKKQEIMETKIRNKNECLGKYLNELFYPFKNLILRIDNIYITDIETYILSNIILKAFDLIIEMDNQSSKDLYLKLKDIKEYYDIQYHDPKTKKNIRGKIMLRRFLNLCGEYSLDKYIIEKYEEYLKKSNLYDNEDFYFIENITSVYIKLVESIIPNIYFI
jgi:curved DNA-binding protein CbpA